MQFKVYYFKKSFLLIRNFIKEIFLKKYTSSSLFSEKSEIFEESVKKSFKI